MNLIMSPETHTALGRLFAQAHDLIAAGDARSALALAQQAWTLAPGNADCSNLIGTCAIAMGDGPAAERCWRQALMQNPQTIEARMNLARYCKETERAHEAETLLQQVLALAPEHAAAYLLLGHLQSARKADQAAHSYRRALTIDPSLAEAWANLALELEKQANWSEAEAHHRRALALALAPGSGSATIHANLGNLLARMHRHGEAEEQYRLALALNPGSAVGHSNLGVLHADLGRSAEAEQSLRAALRCDPKYQLARHNLAMFLLAMGQFEEGWALYEARHHPDLSAPDAPLPALPGKQWQGEPLQGKRLLVWPEQGYGDMIQFCRYLPWLRHQGAASIDLVCRKAQVSLFKTLEGVDRVVALDEAESILDGQNYWTLPMSLPLHHGTRLDNIPAQLPYLHAQEDRRARWQARMATGQGKKVGLVWRGNGHHSNDARRSLPDFSILQPLFANEGLRFFSLQMDQRENLLEQVVDLAPDIEDFADSAAIIAQLDLLITVDTATAHLASALGKPCWVMLPSYRTDWRWLREREDSPWYPDVMRLYRQGMQDDWQAVVERIARDLRSQ